MKFTWFLCLYYYLLNGSYPDGASKVIKQKIRRHAAKFEIRGDSLFDNTTGKEVLHEANVKKVVVQVHEEGHFSFKKMFKQLSAHYVYPGGSIINVCKQVCQECVTCQMRARQKFNRTNVARPIPTPSKVNYMWGVDAVGPLPSCPKSGNRYILTAIEFLTRWPVALAVPNINEVTTTEFFYKCIVSTMGVPNYILSDRGSNFASVYTSTFLKKLGCRAVTTTAYRAQSNGCCERLNQTLCRTIAKIARDKEDIDDWDTYIDQALMVIRSVENVSTGYSPAYLLYGQPLITPGLWSAPIRDFVEGEYEVDLANRVEYVTKEMQDIREAARLQSEKAKSGYARAYNKNVHVREPFKIGEQVLLREYVLNNKFSDKWRGPYVVVARKGDIYYLDGPDSVRIKKGVNGDSLKPFVEHKSMVPDVATASAFEHFKTWVVSNRI